MRGFTLLELLVATAVFVGLALILVSIAASLSSFWQLGIAHNERRSSALAAFSRMARDLRFASLSSDPSATNFQLVINPAKVGSSYLLPQAVFWQAPVASDRSRADTALVGYFVQWVKEADVSVPKLCRLLVDSDYLMQKPSDFVSDALIASNAPATKASGYAGQLAENVLGLWMRPLDQTKNPILNDAKAGAFLNGQFDSARGYTVAFTNASGTFPSALPASLEVALVAVDSRTAKRLSGRASEKPATASPDMWGDINAFYNKLPPEIRPGARIYSTVIDLHSAPR
jgi:prepilin-type N-terminal cleavage/methylation domain-containing protein